MTEPERKAWNAAIEAASRAVDPAIFDHPSVFMGEPSHRAMRLANDVAGFILALTKPEPTE